MLRHAREAASFVANRTYDESLADVLLRRAVERSVQIIGEAASRISAEFRALHPQIPWRAITAQRHILVHEYDVIKDDKVRRVAAVHVPLLVDSLGLLLPPLPPDIGMEADDQPVSFTSQGARSAVLILKRAPSHSHVCAAGTA